MKSAILVALVLVLASGSRSQPQKTKPAAGSTLRIVKDDLIEEDQYSYIVKGSIYNPNTEAVKNVIIKYYIWKKWMGKHDPRFGSIIDEHGGLVSATIKYLPPKQTIEFTATGSPKAGRMTKESGLVPDPIEAEITADWDEP